MGLPLENGNFGCDSERGSIRDKDDRAPAHRRSSSLSLNVKKLAFPLRAATENLSQALCLCRYPEKRLTQVIPERTAFQDTDRRVLTVLVPQVSQVIAIFDNPYPRLTPDGIAIDGFIPAVNENTWAFAEVGDESRVGGVNVRSIHTVRLFG